MKNIIYNFFCYKVTSLRVSITIVISLCSLNNFELFLLILYHLISIDLPFINLTSHSIFGQHQITLIISNNTIINRMTHIKNIGRFKNTGWFKSVFKDNVIAFSNVVVSACVCECACVAFLHLILFNNKM